MNYSRRVVENTPRISISNIKLLAKTFQGGVIQLALTTREGESLSRFVRIGSTPCHFGGRRSWFECGQCGRRAGVLFVTADVRHLVCRLCSGVRYRSQMSGGSSRTLSRVFDAEEKASAVFDRPQRVQLFYKDQPTRRFRRYLAYRNQAERLSRVFLH